MTKNKALPEPEDWAAKFIPAPPSPRFTIVSIDGPEHCRFYVEDRCVYSGDHRQGLRQMDEAGLVRVGDFYRLHHRGTEFEMKMLSRAERGAGISPVVSRSIITKENYNDAAA
jgi:hypothetical protein